MLLSLRPKWRRAKMGEIGIQKEHVEIPEPDWTEAPEPAKAPSREPAPERVPEREPDTVPA